ncbi:polyprenyl diphosphate synthase [Candidatus Clavichlamydia salmonicola]|uniref:polyprenyl diphosphate synthase n=1 Tax=Candidatus Clavichlamydia salmonicola TaxID=469812 RepID=UPI001E3784AF|nr:polyprenyl diphosphate synthase [Candidatus Clavichlamydia salmonicola]
MTDTAFLDSMNESVTTEEHVLHYSKQELDSVQKNKFPAHIAIIMDGNRRWAKKQGYSKETFNGHTIGAKQPRIITEAALQLGIKTLTFFAFSTENNERSSLEILHLFDLFIQGLQQERPFLQKNGIRFNVIGNTSLLPKTLIEEITITKEMTKKNDKFNLILAMNYGGRDEIIRATRLILKDMIEHPFNPESINEKKFSSYLDTAPYGDPDLLIRTSGEMRVSNFLLWQIAYTEFFVTQTLWPDFSPKDLLHAVMSFQKRNRRQGL